MRKTVINWDRPAFGYIMFEQLMPIVLDGATALIPLP